MRPKHLRFEEKTFVARPNLSQKDIKINIKPIDSKIKGRPKNLKHAFTDFPDRSIRSRTERFTIKPHKYSLIGGQYRQLDNYDEYDYLNKLNTADLFKAYDILENSFTDVKFQRSGDIEDIIGHNQGILQSLEDQGYPVPTLAHIDIIENLRKEHLEIVNIAIENFLDETADIPQPIVSESPSTTAGTPIRKSVLDITEQRARTLAGNIERKKAGDIPLSSSESSEQPKSQESSGGSYWETLPSDPTANKPQSSAESIDTFESVPSRFESVSY